VLVAETEEILQQNLEVYQKELRKVNGEENIEKSKTMIITTEERKQRIAIQGQVVEQVTNYTILEEAEKIDKEIK
jgi:hypothetical protein